ncbi:MAG: hypothetical protein MUC51_04860 [Anaerolineae bacterium]|jgi:hypothetical protein|nr:hypothetical protein [Anaerolineae bacterium]
MGKHRFSKWWGLYALVPLMIALLVIDADAAMSQTWHLILLAGIVYIVCALALSWIDAHPRLVERSRLAGEDGASDASAPRIARRLHAAVADEWESVPIRHSVTDD